MATRRALLISNPGEQGDEHYCKGVYVYIANYRRIMESAHGGAWKADEIVELAKPSVDLVRAYVALLANYDYSFIAFAGHGYYSTIDKATVLKLQKKVELSSVELYKNATKRTVVLDCCREEKNKSALMRSKEGIFTEARKEATYRKRPDPARCRAHFDKMVASASAARVVIESCSPGETAGDDEKTGGYYTFNYIGSADAWADATAKNSFALIPAAHSVAAAHDAAELRTVAESRERDQNKIQNPTIQKPRTELNYFPFAVFA